MGPRIVVSRNACFLFGIKGIFFSTENTLFVNLRPPLRCCFSENSLAVAAFFSQGFHMPGNHRHLVLAPEIKCRGSLGVWNPCEKKAAMAIEFSGKECLRGVLKLTKKVFFVEKKIPLISKKKLHS